MTANERDLGVDVVHRCFPEKGDYILSVISSEPCERSCKTTNEFLWLAD